MVTPHFILEWIHVLSIAAVAVAGAIHVIGEACNSVRRQGK